MISARNVIATSKYICVFLEDNSASLHLPELANQKIATGWHTCEIPGVTRQPCVHHKKLAAGSFYNCLF
jgi:hypothetical protein